MIEAVAPQDVQLLNATIEGEANGWKVMNFLSKVDCIDQDRSRIIYHPLDHPYRPGKPMFCDRLAIDESRAHGHHFFLLQFGSQEIVSETMRRAIEAAGITGMTYGHRPVNLP